MSAENRTTLLDLPVEIITRIIKDVDGASVYERRKGRLLSGIAPTCHLFRHLVESILFGELDLRSSEATYGLSEEDLEIQLKNQHSDACLDEFIRLFEESLTSALRKTSLRVLYYPLRWSMPELGSNDDDDDDDEDKVYTLEQVAVPSKEFSSKTQKLLSTLSRWENEEPGFSLYELRLCISPTGPSTTRYCHFRLCDDSFDHNAHQVRTVRKLILEGPEVFSQDWGVLHLGSAWKIARFFPALKAFDLRSGDSEKLDVEARKASRFGISPTTPPPPRPLL
ncbi:hypothetical protein FN846DRAFT_894387 [Sphaerosporella brunnea]|uniref:F-box domain-containing protein n=1 Tax=Sphaerosporella brunnea TaxID=1250544 RepID=A0A5J5EJJ7_9PEZI|nr:hypothetical protein FN846DRAFT_894387 [Sphaerosporella brunnea]